MTDEDEAGYPRAGDTVAAASAGLLAESDGLRERLAREIARRQAAEAALDECHTHYRHIIDHLPHMLWLASPDGDIVALDPTWARHTGGSTKSALGVGWQASLHPEDITPTFEAMARSRESGAPYEIRHRLRMTDGSYRWIESQAHPRRDADGAITAWYGSSRDVHDQVQAEAALRDNEARLRLALEAGQLTSWDWNLETDQVIWHGNDHNLLGYDVAGNGMTRKAWTEHVHPDDRAAVAQAVGEALARRQRYSFDYRVTTATGGVAWISSTARAEYGPDGKPVRLVGVMHDITERKQAEADLRRAQDDLLRLSRLGAMGAMASTLAHELNQPLTAATTYLAACKRRLARMGADSMLDEAIDRAIAEALRAGEIIRRARRFTISGEIMRRPEDLGAIVDDALAAAARLEAGDGVTQRRDLAHGDARVLVDRVQLEQVLTNIMRNAVEAMTGQPHRVLHVASRRDGDMIELRIADTGPGLPPDRLSALFLPFATTKPSGTGLGLPICRTIVEAHGGRVWAEQPAGGGALFVLLLPAAAAETAAA